MTGVKNDEILMMMIVSVGGNRGYCGRSSDGSNSSSSSGNSGGNSSGSSSST